MQRQPMSERDLPALEALYLEALAFLRQCGGVYAELKPYQCQRVLECIDHGQYLLRRNQEGELVQFVAYWRIREEDFELAKRFERPADPFSGPVVFSVDYASLDGVRGAMAMFLEQLPKHEPGVIAGCFEHKGRFMVYDRTGETDRPWRLRR